jgi:3-deoxy-D-manno-octulosonic-acid transferase
LPDGRKIPALSDRTPREATGDREVARLLSDAGARAWLAEAGEGFCAAHRGATARTMAIVERLIAGT